MRFNIFVAPMVAALLLAGCNQEQQESVDNTMEQAGNAIEDTVESAEPAIDEARDDLSDAGITGRVKTALVASDKIDSTGINVDTENKVVTLNGTVPKPAQQRLAESVAKNTVGEGVTVVNQLKVQAPAQSTPATQ